MFSSQPGEQDDSGLGFKPNSRYLQWPRLLDSVALCYLAALLMRLPVCVSDFYEYVYCFLFTSLKYALEIWGFMLTYSLSMIIRQEIPYARVLASVPREMREKLPPELTEILETNVSIIRLQPYSKFNLTQNHEETPQTRASPSRCTSSSFVLSASIRSGISSSEFACTSLPAHQEIGFAK